mmetsp:Transcript_674/g.1330  ORF Transcript_674/g.1330 Transcript_674/m.1330 type:complete len:153 (-) Transcript_674:122-580(-)
MMEEETIVHMTTALEGAIEIGAATERNVALHVKEVSAIIGAGGHQTTTNEADRDQMTEGKTERKTEEMIAEMTEGEIGKSDAEMMIAKRSIAQKGTHAIATMTSEAEGEARSRIGLIRLTGPQPQDARAKSGQKRSQGEMAMRQLCRQILFR